MMRRSVRFALPALALAVILLLPDTSFAQRWGRGRYGGYYGGYGNYGRDGYRYGGYGRDGGYWAGRRPYDGYFGPSLYGRPYYGGYSGSFYGSVDGSPYYSTPYYASGPIVDGTTISQAFYPSAQPTDSTLGRILVRVAPEAEVMFDGNATQQKGVDRIFETPPLAQNKNYSYEVTVKFRDQTGQDRTEKRTVQPMPGRTVTVDFLQGQPGQIQNPPREEKQPLQKDNKKNPPKIGDQDR